MKLEFNKKTFSEILIHVGGGGGGIREFEERIGAKKVKSVIEFKISHENVKYNYFKVFCITEFHKESPSKNELIV